MSLRKKPKFPVAHEDETSQGQSDAFGQQTDSLDLDPKSMLTKGLVTFSSKFWASNLHFFITPHTSGAGKLYANAAEPSQERLGVLLLPQTVICRIPLKHT